MHKIEVLLARKWVCFVSPVNLGLLLGKETVLGRAADWCQRIRDWLFSKWWWTWWCRWLCTKEKGTAKGVFSFVIITWYCPFNSWGNSTSRCTASDSYWFEWLSGARLIGPRDWNNDSAARGELTRQSLSVCWRAGFAAVLACPREQGAYLAGWKSLPLSCLRTGQDSVDLWGSVKTIIPRFQEHYPVLHPVTSQASELGNERPVLYPKESNFWPGPSCITCPQGLQH